MRKLTILQGLPCSGKSTFAKSQQAKHDGIVRVNRDTLRALLHNNEFNNPNEKLTNLVRDYIITTSLEKNRWVIIDDTNLNPKVVRQLRKLAGPDTPVEVIHFDITPDVAWERELARRNSDANHIHVPRNVIDDMYKRWHSGWKDADTTIDWDAPGDIVEFIEGLPSAVVCDLDGTLAHMVDRGPYEHMRCDTDEVDPRVANALDLYSQQGFRIILMSGRDGESRSVTETWLQDNGIAYDDLWMRAQGDQRKDSIIKRELFDEHVRGKYNIHVVFDDRNQVVNTWREMGLVVWQVAPGNF